MNKTVSSVYKKCLSRLKQGAITDFKWGICSLLGDLPSLQTFSQRIKSQFMTNIRDSAWLQYKVYLSAEFLLISWTSQRCYNTSNIYRIYLEAFTLKQGRKCFLNINAISEIKHFFIVCSHQERYLILVDSDKMVDLKQNRSLPPYSQLRQLRSSNFVPGLVPPLWPVLLRPPGSAWHANCLSRSLHWRWKCALCKYTKYWPHTQSLLTTYINFLPS